MNQDFAPFCCVCSVAQSCPTLGGPVDCSPPGSSVHGILQARILEWGAISFSRGSSQLRDWTQVSCVSCMADGCWAIREAHPPFYGQIICHCMDRPDFFLSILSLMDIYVFGHTMYNYVILWHIQLKAWGYNYKGTVFVCFEVKLV